MREQLNFVIVGHVDHGKSTVIGRLLADSNALPEGRLESIREQCARESKVFEYAMLLDALEDERNQGITIDAARCHFSTDKRDYFIVDAPGHIEFLKNMVTGATRAEAAVIVIDAHEGIQENSKRHSFLLSLLGIQQVIVCINKMDLIDYDEKKYDQILDEYDAFLNSINITPLHYIPIAALNGENIVTKSPQMEWYKGSTLLSALEGLEKKAPDNNLPLRMPVQDIYKFTSKGDARRIVAGRITSGTLRVGDKVMFLPSNKTSTVASIEGFNLPEQEVVNAGTSTGVTLTEQIYIQRGDIMCKEPTKVSSGIHANIFWMGKAPLKEGEQYTLKLGTQKVPVTIEKSTALHYRK